MIDKSVPKAIHVRMATAFSPTSARARTHPPRYLMHKYWSRKPWSRVREALLWGSPPGGRVLDLFCGSGVATIEAALLGRRAVGIDLNPMAIHIARHTLRPVESDLLREAYAHVEAACRREVEALYAFRCPCGAMTHLTHLIWNEFYSPHYHPERVKFRCEGCGRKGWHVLEPGERDAARGIEADVPRLWRGLHASAHQSVQRVEELFTGRARAALELIYRAIQELPDVEMRDWMRFVFTAALPQASRLVFVIDHRGRGDGAEARNRAELGSWTIPNYWIPARHFEVNAWRCFAERFRKVERGKADLSGQATTGSGEFICADAAHACRALPKGSFDMLFADPPYGGAVPYLGLSLMWAAWLEEDDALDFDREIMILPGDGRVGIDQFRERLAEAFTEARRLLHPDSKVVVTFNQKSPEVWEALEEAMLEAGYRPGGRTDLPGARPSAKSLLVPTGSMKGDAWLTYFPK